MSQTIRMTSASLASASDSAAVSANLGSSWRQHAAWLARLWRLSPLTLLLHHDAKQVDVLMEEGLLPLTARREIDRGWAGMAAASGTATDKAMAIGDSPRCPERVFQLDAMQGRDPVARLRHRLQALLPASARSRLPVAPSLVELARSAQEQGLGRMLLVVREFDTLMAPRHDDPAPRQALCDAIVALLSTPDLGVHVLLVVNENADVLLDGLRRSLPQLDDHRLRVSGAAGPLQPATRAAPASTDAEFQRSLDALLLRVAHFEGSVRKRSTPPPTPAAHAPEPVPVTPPAPMPPPAPTPAPVPVTEPPAPVVPPIELPPQPAPPFHAPPKVAMAAAKPRHRVPAGVFVFTGLGLFGALALGLWTQGAGRLSDQVGPVPEQSAQAPVRPSPAPVVAAVPPPAAAAAAATATDELMAAIAVADLPWVQTQGDTDWASALRQLGSSPGLALVRYDELQAARAWADAPPLQVLAPLYLEPVIFVVRVDSALRSLHELGGARVNLGPPDSARALAARSAWQGLFQQAVPAAQANALPAADAWAALRAGTVDAVAWVGAWPPADLGPAAAGLRLLTLDTQHASTARLRQRFLVAPQPDEAPGLALMSFLVSSASTPAATQRAAARDLCAALPALRAKGQAVWQAVQPVPPLPTGWPTTAAVAAEFDRCADVAAAPAARVSLPSSLPTPRPRRAS